MESWPVIVAGIVAAVLIVVGIGGIIVPVLPGSPLVAIGLLVWAIFAGDPWVWGLCAIGIIAVIAGMTSGLILTSRGLKRDEIPGRTVTIAIIAGIIGFFVLPAFGLPIGFILGLVGAEYYRQRDWSEAGKSSISTLKSLGIGLIIELGCALFASMLFATSIILKLVVSA